MSIWIDRWSNFESLPILASLKIVPDKRNSEELYLKPLGGPSWRHYVPKQDKFEYDMKHRWKQSKLKDENFATKRDNYNMI